MKMLASHAGVYRGASFHPSPQTPAQAKTTFLSQAWPITLYFPNTGKLTLTVR